MNSKNFSQDVQEALNYLSFDDIPTMKELNTRYRRLALLKHPDKNGGSDTSKEDYQELQKFYKLIGNCIIENDTPVCDEEERDQFEAFKNFNFDKKNKFCHTVLIENKLTSSWKQVLSSKLGEPEGIDDERGEEEKPHLCAEVPSLSNALAATLPSKVVDVEQIFPPFVNAKYGTCLNVVMGIH